MLFTQKQVTRSKKIVILCNDQKIPITVYGGGSGTVGGVFPLNGGITIDMGKLNNIIEFDRESELISVESGLILDNLEESLNYEGYTIRHFPQSMKSASIGGLIATKSVGQFSTKYGGIEDILVGLDVLLPNGKIVKTTRVPRTSTGPDIKNIFIGSEGTFGIILTATLKVLKIPEKMIFSSYLCQDFFKGIDAIKELLQSGLKPPVIRLYNQEESELKFRKIGLNKKGSLLILCHEGLKNIVDSEIKETNKICQRHGLTYTGDKIGKMWYKHRFDTKGIMEYNQKTGGISDAIEISVNWNGIKKLYQEVIQYFKKNSIKFAAHLSHIYPTGASIYFIYYVKSDDESKAEKLFFQTWNEVLMIILKNNASISHHHGIGIVKKELLKEELGEGYDILLGIKNCLDPNKILNKGKLVD